MDKEKNNNIILFPEYDKIKKNVEKLRTELSMLVLERDELLYTECKNLEMKYMLVLGALEYKAYEAQCRALRFKRKLELIRARKNRQEKIILSEIEEILDSEFKEYQEELNMQINKMNEALERSKGKLLTDEESKELKRLYRIIVKKLHPDMNPNISEEQLRLFINAVEAYKSGSLESMRIIYDMLGDDKPDIYEENAMEKLLNEQKRLEEAIDKVKTSITHIKEEYPYTIKDILNDSEKIEEKKTELNKITEQYKEMADFYERSIKEAMS